MYPKIRDSWSLRGSRGEVGVAQRCRRFEASTRAWNVRAEGAGIRLPRKLWFASLDSNQDGPASKAGELPLLKRRESAELKFSSYCTHGVGMVRLPGFEPGTRRFRICCATVAPEAKRSLSRAEPILASRPLGELAEV